MGSVLLLNSTATIPRAMWLSYDGNREIDRNRWTQIDRQDAEAFNPVCRQWSQKRASQPWRAEGPAEVSAHLMGSPARIHSWRPPLIRWMPRWRGCCRSRYPVKAPPTGRAWYPRPHGRRSNGMSVSQSSRGSQPGGLPNGCGDHECLVSHHIRENVPLKTSVLLSRLEAADLRRGVCSLYVVTDHRCVRCVPAGILGEYRKQR